MSHKIVQFLQLSTAALASYAGYVGELVWDTTKKAWVGFDSSTLGGFTMAREDLVEALGKFKGINAITGSRSLALTDIGYLLQSTAAGAHTITVPTNATAAFPIGTVLNGVQYGAGQITFAAASGVTINATGVTLKSAAQFAPYTLTKIGTNEWLLCGALTT